MPQNQRKPGPQRLPDTTCYACRSPVHLGIEPGRQYCQTCQAPLQPAPSWVKEAGWPQQPITPNVRRHAAYHARWPVKQVRFRGNENRLLARRVEAYAQLRGQKMNLVLIDLIRLGLESACRRHPP